MSGIGKRCFSEKKKKKTANSFQTIPSFSPILTVLSTAKMVNKSQFRFAEHNILSKVG